MLKKLESKLNQAWYPALVGALLAAGLLLPTLRLLGLTAYGSAVRACLVTALACLAAGLGGLFSLAGLGAGAAVCAGWLFSGDTLSRLGGMLGAALALRQGNAAPLAVYAPELATVLAIVLTLVGWALSLRPGGIFPALSLVLIAALSCWAGGMREGFGLFAPALVALLALFAHASGDASPRGGALAISVCAVALALCLAQVFSGSSATLKGLAESLRTYITDTFFFTETRTVYSLEVDGFIPLSSRLGGEAQPDDHPVMLVETPRALLLRGSIQNQYTGLSWRNTLSSRRYRYQSARFAKLRDEATDDALPVETLRQSDLFTPVPVRVEMYCDSASTLFTLLRMQNLTTPMSLVPYFSTSSEIFITRDLAAGDSYTFEAPVITGDDERLDALLPLAAQGAPEKDLAEFLALPSAIAQDVYTLTEKLVSTCDTPLEKACAICTYLRHNMAYTLTPQTPPDNQDFVSYFLLRGKEGYCTYFASAMAVMGRIAGLPTRYVEGYLAQPSGGIALVTGKDAHAWAEVWFDGFGWVAFDATPAHGGGSSDPNPPQSSDGGSDEENDGEQTPGEDSDRFGDAAPTPSPQPDGEDSQQGGSADAAPTPSPAPPDDAPQSEQNPTPSPSPLPDDNQQGGGNENNRPGRWWLWLLLVLLAAALTLRILYTTPKSSVRRFASADEKLLLWYRALLGLLECARLGAQRNESPSAHALRVAAKLPKDSGFLEVADSLTMLGYGRYGATPAQAEQAALCYHRLWHALPLWARVAWFARRTVKGLGSVAQVP